MRMGSHKGLVTDFPEAGPKLILWYQFAEKVFTVLAQEDRPFLKKKKKKKLKMMPGAGGSHL